MTIITHLTDGAYSTNTKSTEAFLNKFTEILQNLIPKNVIHT
jgi:hypothetical protein